MNINYCFFKVIAFLLGIVYAPGQWTVKTPAFTEMVTLANKQFIRVIGLEPPGRYIPSYTPWSYKGCT